MRLPKSVLIVDDEAHIRFFLKLVCKEIGIKHCFEAENGEEAVALYEDIEPELVLMDVNMPLRTGTEALGEILSFDPDAIVIMMSSVAKRQVVETAADLGAAQYIRKDASREEMLAMMTGIIGQIWVGGDDPVSADAPPAGTTRPAVGGSGAAKPPVRGLSRPPNPPRGLSRAPSN